jgi:hypothetical protein
MKLNLFIRKIFFCLSFIAFACVAISCARPKKFEVNASAVIAKNLGSNYRFVDHEALLIDRYRDFYCVFFTLKSVSDQVRVDVLKSGLTPYETNERERHDLYLHRSEYKGLTKLKWEPPREYGGCDRYIGTWEGKYLVFVVVCGDQVFGYYQNNYDLSPGPGPFR